MKKIAATAFTLVAAFVLVSTAYAAGTGKTESAQPQTPAPEPAAATEQAAYVAGPEVDDTQYRHHTGNADGTHHNAGCPNDGSCLVNGVCSYGGAHHNAGCPSDGSCLVDGVCSYNGVHHSEGCPSDGSCLVDGVCSYNGVHHSEGGSHHNGGRGGHH